MLALKFCEGLKYNFCHEATLNNNIINKNL